MKKLLTITLILSVISLGVFLTIYLINKLQKKPGGILVISNIKSEVLIDGKSVGKTPYEGNYTKESLNVKVIPEGGLPSYEAVVKITSKFKSVVSRNFKTGDPVSAGEVVYFEKVAGKSSAISIFSYPKNSQVFINGVARGFAPYKTDILGVGEYEVKLTSEGYQEKVLNIELQSGYRLVIDSILSKAADIAPSQVAGAQNEKKYVTIKETPTGYLRVRSTPIAGEEIDELKPGSRYELLDTDPETGWYKILLEEAKPGLPNGRSGWISNEFSDTDN